MGKERGRTGRVGGGEMISRQIFSIDLNIKFRPF